MTHSADTGQARRVALFDLDHTLLPIDSDYAWGVNLGSGYAFGNDQSFRYRVRAVRAGQLFDLSPASPVPL